MRMVVGLVGAALAAEKAWQAELERLFGGRAGTIRYQARGEGEPGTPLRALFEEYRRTRDAAFPRVCVG